MNLYTDTCRVFVFSNRSAGAHRVPIEHRRVVASRRPISARKMGKRNKKSTPKKSSPASPGVKTRRSRRKQKQPIPPKSGHEPDHQSASVIDISLHPSETEFTSEEEFTEQDIAALRREKERLERKKHIIELRSEVASLQEQISAVTDQRKGRCGDKGSHRSRKDSPIREALRVHTAREEGVSRQEPDESRGTHPNYYDDLLNPQHDEWENSFNMESPQPSGRRHIPHLLIGDSIVKCFFHVVSGPVVSVSGGKLHDFTGLAKGYKVKERYQYDISGFEAITYAVGTNNITQDTVADIKDGFQKLFFATKQRNSDATIIFATILPRPIDHYNTGSKVQEINLWLHQWARCGGIQIVDTYDKFAYKWGGTRNELFSDGLHLNQIGLRKLRDILTGRITKILRPSLPGFGGTPAPRYVRQAYGAQEQLY